MRLTRYDDDLVFLKLEANQGEMVDLHEALLAGRRSAAQRRLLEGLAAHIREALPDTKFPEPPSSEAGDDANGDD